MRRRSVSRGEEEEATINLTPLIDVVFVVLIMFILVAPLLELDRIELAAAGTHAQKEMVVVQESSPITIHVHADDSVWINSVKIAEKELLSALLRAKQQNPQRTPQLFQDKRAHFGIYQTVKNALETAGFEELDIVLQPG